MQLGFTNDVDICTIAFLLFFFVFLTWENPAFTVPTCSSSNFLLDVLDGWIHTSKNCTAESIDERHNETCKCNTVVIQKMWRILSFSIRLVWIWHFSRIQSLINYSWEEIEWRMNWNVKMCPQIVGFQIEPFPFIGHFLFQSTVESNKTGK